MGGCRCSFRNCSLRTDGKTHMFHYPVFDKVRCHQWLTNAHKLEFLNLKVSQLKNRVVCQHHFKDDSFMNFMKDRLTFDAVPTEDGPYCDSSQTDETKFEQDESKVFSISLDDIENEYLTLGDKRANFSVKYGDFLTNCDLMDLDSLNSLNQISDNNQISIKGLSEIEPVSNVPKIQVLTKRPAKSMQPLTRRNREKRYGNSSRSIIKKTYNKNTLTPGNLTVNHDNTVDISQLIETPRTKEDKKSLNIVLNVSHVPVEFESTKSNDEIQENLDQSKLNDQSIDLRAFDDAKLLNDQAIDVRAFNESKLYENVQSVDVRAFDESKLLNDQTIDVRTFNESKLLNENYQSVDVRAFDESKLLNDQAIDIKAYSEPQLLNDQAIDIKAYSEPQLLNDQSVKVFDESKLLNDKLFDVKVLNEPKLSNNNANKTLLKERKKIRIISEKKISEPVPLIGKFEPVSPTRILNFPNKRKFFNQNPIVEIPEVPVNTTLETAFIATEPSKDNVVLERAETEPLNITSSRTDNVNPQEIINDVINFIPNEVLPNNASPQRTKCDVINKSPNEVSLKTSLFKNRIPPERMAAIAEKRKFNMKLRDIIEDCLDKLDRPDKSNLDKRKTNMMESKKQQVGSYLAKNPDLPNVQDYTIAFLEARMKKMENNLLNKIEENSQKIVELKQIYAPSCGKKSVHTQTSVSEDVHKKQLYQELSKYLSQEANSLVYEELFINKYTKEGPSSKKRRRRR